MNKTVSTLAAALILLTGCSTWSTSQVSSVRVAKEEMAKVVLPEQVLISESDITDRPYKSLRDISVTVNKTTVFHSNPTRAMVNQKLQEEAAKLGADAVVFVRYGEVGVSLMSWGTLEGKGRAVVFTR